MTKFRVTSKKNGIISLEVEPAPRDPPSLEDKEKKRYLKQEISKNSKFESFLKENKVYGRFISNFMNENKHYSLDKFKIRTININCSYPIDYCLDWAITREGFGFWQNLNHKYCINQ